MERMASERGGMMDGDALYKMAVRQMKRLADNVLLEVEMFADNNNYEKEWVLERFKEEFSKNVRKWKNE